MKLLTKLTILAGITMLIKYKFSPKFNIDGNSTSEELTKIWGKQGLYTVIPGFGLANAIIDSLKVISKTNTKGVKRYGQ